MDEIITRDKEKLSKLAQTFRKEFGTAETLRRDTELLWAEDLRQSKGIYDPEELTRIEKNKGSSVYPKYTRSKEVPCVAKLNNMLFPSNDRNWDIGITPKPKLTDTQIKEIAATLTMKDGDKSLLTEEMVAKAIRMYAKGKADNMRLAMDDQLTEINITEIDKKVIKSGVRYGTGIKKGALIQTVYETVTETDDLGNIKQTQKPVRKPFVEYVRLWNWYPDMSVTEYANTRYSFELHCLDRSELRALAMRNDFWGDEIKLFLKDNLNGNYKFKNWEIDLQNIGTDQKERVVDKKYEVLERNGFVDGYDLQSAGIEVSEDELDTEFYAVAWLIGDTIIKMAKLDKHPKDNPLYHIFYLDKDESSIFGSGLPRSIRDTQLSICAAQRGMLDNAAAVSGPITETNVDLLDIDEDPDDWYPRRNFKRTGRGGEASFPAIRAVNVESHIQEYILIKNDLKRTGDEESAFPAMVFGEPIAAGNETVGGMSIRSSNMNVTIGDVVKNFDTMNESFLRGLYKWNMDFNPDPSIKGDAQIKAKGYSSLLSKEMRTQALDFFATTLTPQDEPYIKRRWFLEQRMKLHDLDAEAGLNTEEDARALIEAQQDREAQALAKAKLEAEVRYDHAKASSMEAKAAAVGKKIQVDAVAALALAGKTDAEADAKKADSVIKIATALKGGKDGNKPK